MSAAVCEDVSGDGDDRGFMGAFLVSLLMWACIVVALHRVLG